MVDLNQITLITTSNINGLNTPQLETERLNTKARVNHILSIRNHCKNKGTPKKSERKETIYHANINQEKDGMAVLISDSIDFKQITGVHQLGHSILLRSQFSPN